MMTYCEVEKVTSRTFFVKTPFSNAGAIMLDKTIVAIDSLMFPALAHEFIETIRQYSNLPINYLIFTHCHADHVCGSYAFKGANIIGSTRLIENMQQYKDVAQREEAFKAWKQAEPEKQALINSIHDILVPDIGFDTSYTLQDDAYQFHLHCTGGHTNGSLFVYAPFERVVFAGDLLFAHSFPWAGSDTCDPDAWIEAYKTLLTLEVDIVIPGHGMPVTLEEIEKHLHFFKALRAEVQEALRQGNDEGAIVLPSFYPPLKEKWVQGTLTHWMNFYKNNTVWKEKG